MTRSDRRGRSLKAFVQAEIAGTDVTIEELRKACGLTRASYYGEPSGTGRGFDDNFPNSEELRQVAERYQLGDNGWVSLLVEFGWLEPIPGTLRMPFSADKSDRLTAPPIGLVTIRDAFTRYQNASVLVVAPDRTHVSLSTARDVLRDNPDDLIMVFGATPAVDSDGQ